MTQHHILHHSEAQRNSSLGYVVAMLVLHCMLRGGDQHLVLFLYYYFAGNAQGSSKLDGLQEKLAACKKTLL